MVLGTAILAIVLATLLVVHRAEATPFRITNEIYLVEEFTGTLQDTPPIQYTERQLDTIQQAVEDEPNCIAHLSEGSVKGVYDVITWFVCDDGYAVGTTETYEEARARFIENNTPTSQEIIALLNVLTTYYSCEDYLCSTLDVVKSGAGCNGTFEVDNFGTWNNIPSSLKVKGGCNLNITYSEPSQVGSQLNCTGNCATMYSMDNSGDSCRITG